MISRRDFLKTAGGIVGGYIFGTQTGEFLVKNYREQIFGAMDWMEVIMKLSIEGQKKLDEVVNFRKSLGLDGLPNEVWFGLHTPEMWEGNLNRFTDNLPEKNKSYGMRVSEVVYGLFGENGTRNILGVKPDPEHPYGISFDGNSRYCNIGDSVHGIPIEDEFTDFALHEACGHGTDPSCGAKYPPEILAKVEHGKWRALSQCLSIPGQFLNHPGDLMFPLLKQSVGEAVGCFMAGKDNSSISDLTSIPVIQAEISKITTKHGKTINTVKYNKAVCKEVGEVMVAMQRQGKIKFNGSLKEAYQGAMEDACTEIYAEMFKYALKYPDKIGKNTNIMDGIKEVVLAIGSESSMENFKRNTLSPSDGILSRNEAEKTAMNMIQTPEQSTVSLPTTTLTVEEQKSMGQEQLIFEKEEHDFMLFSVTGTWPETLMVKDSQFHDFREFALSYIQVANKYQILKDTFAQQYDEGFDPELHIWEIREIESAMDSGFVRNLLVSNSITEQTMIDIKAKQIILNKFIESPAF
jgi:hypothetical protein